MEDALSCVENIESVGGRSKEYTDKRRNPPPSNSEPFCSMPVKITFSDRSARINFEKTLSDEAGIRASQSYPKPIRDEMTLFRNALLERYPDFLIMTRPAPAPALELVAFKKKDGDRKWVKLPESHPLPMDIMLPSYKAPSKLTLSVLNGDDSQDKLPPLGGGAEQEDMNCE